MNQTEYRTVLENKKRLEVERNQLKIKKANVIELQQEVQKLEKDPQVKLYLQKMNELEITKSEIAFSKELNDTEIAREAVDEVLSVDKNNIYVYEGIGTKNGKYGELEEENYDYRIYRSLEEQSDRPDYYIDKEDVARFEEEHIILYPPKGMVGNNFYQFVRNRYCKILIEFGPEVAENQILKEFHSKNRWEEANQRILSRFMKKCVTIHSLYSPILLNLCGVFTPHIN